MNTNKLLLTMSKMIIFNKHSFASIICGCLFAALSLLAAGPCAAQDTGKNSPAWQKPITAKEAFTALARAMRKRNYLPPQGSGLQLADYIKTGVGAINSGNRRSGTRFVYLMIGPKGHIIPDVDWYQGHPDYCKKLARKQKQITNTLNFKIYRLRDKPKYGKHAGKMRDQIFVFAQFINPLAGRKVLAQKEVSTTAYGSPRLVMKNHGALYDAVDWSWNRLPVSVKPPIGPCGEVRVQHISGSLVGESIDFFAGWKGYGKSLDYTWNFGVSGASVTRKGGQYATNEYGKPGNYTVRVRATDKYGRQATGDVKVVIKENDKHPLNGKWTVTYNTGVMACRGMVINVPSSGQPSKVTIQANKGGKIIAVEGTISGRRGIRRTVTMYRVDSDDLDFKIYDEWKPTIEKAMKKEGLLYEATVPIPQNTAINYLVIWNESKPDQLKGFLTSKMKGCSIRRTFQAHR